MTETGYGDQYGQNYGSIKSNTSGDETMLTNLATLQANDSLILQGSILRATAQSERFAIYIHQMPDGSLELVQETAEGCAQVSLKGGGKALIKEILG